VGLLLTYAREFTVSELREHIESIEEILSADNRLKLAASNSTSNQFEHSSELDDALLDAVMALQKVQPAICRRSISSAAIRNMLKRVLLYSFDLHDTLLRSEADPT
jgi:hypothetical protein